MKLKNLGMFGGAPVYTGTWPTWPSILQVDELVHRFSEVLNSGRWTIRAPSQGPSLLEEFEKSWAARCGCEFVLGVTSGSSALDIALKALGAGAGAEIIVPALGWYATAAAVCRSGATPVFADVDPYTSCLDPGDLDQCLSSRTAGVIAVHLHCALADLDALRSFTTAHKLWLLEDAAQAHGGAYHDRPVGSIGDIGCFSFNQEKQLAAGEGGALVTSHPELYGRAFSLRTDGYAPLTQSSRQFVAHGAVQGNNHCLSELHAALLLHQLKAFDEQLDVRTKHCSELLEALSQVPEVIPLQSARGTTARPCYEFGFLRRAGSFGNWSLPLIAKALGAELQTDVHPTDIPLPVCPQLGLKPTAVPQHASYIYDNLLVFHHRHLLCPEMGRVLPEALRKIIRAAENFSQAEIISELDDIGLV